VGPDAPNVLGDNNGATGVWNTGTWGADVSGHGLLNTINYEANTVGEAPRTGGPGAGKQCTVCHDATYVGATPTRPHFDGLDTNRRLRATINGVAVPLVPPATNYGAAADATCVNCHQNSAGADAATARSQVATHGNAYVGALEPAFTRQCRQCHEVHGGSWNGLTGVAPNLGRNLHMIGTWIDVNNNGLADPGDEARVDSNAIDATTNITTADIAVKFTTNTGENSYDDGFNDSLHDSVCAVCHQGLRPAHGPDNQVTSTALMNTGHNPVGGDCTQCHKHENPLPSPPPAIAFKARCEDCHNGVQTAYPLAPNVMGDGTSPSGTGLTPRPYDDGTYGYNVNGHGRDDDTVSISHGNPIAVDCTVCHDISQPPDTHLDGTLNGRLTPTDTRTANSFHLVAGFIEAVPTNDWDVQLTFDKHCWTACHLGKTTDMRHAIDSDPAENAVQLGTKNSYDVPLAKPPPEMFYDRNLKSAATFGGYDGIPNWALCVSCHNPHGTDVKSPRDDLNNKMAIYRWATPAKLCARCHD